MYKDIRNVCLDPVSVPRITGSGLKIFRCGRCVNCLKQRANELSVRAYREFHGQSVVFMTFTYDNKHCPIHHVHLEVDTSSGEVLFESSDVTRDETFFDRAPFEWKSNKKGHSVKRFAPLITCVDKFLPSSNMYQQHIDVEFPSVYYYDIQCLFKRFRQKYNDVLKTFICVPEYGGVGYRPHYHLMAFGLTNEHCEWLSNAWSFGSVDIRFPKASDVREISKLSMYVAKYCTKGKFDCPYIAQGFCIKPRRSSSIGFGCGQDFDRLRDVVIGRDVFGITDPWFFNDCPIEFSEYQLRVLADRRKYNINGYNYPFPKYLLNKILKKNVKFYKYIKEDLNENGKSTFYEIQSTENLPYPVKGVSYKVISSPLQKEIAHYLLVNFISDALREQRESQRKFSDICLLNEKFEAEEWRLSAAREAIERQFVSDMYNNSLF